jgi:hypothetical protein
MSRMVHHFEHGGRQYAVCASLLTDQPAVYTVEVYRDREKGAHGTALISLTVRADHDHAFIENSGVFRTAFERGEELVKALYL